MLQEGFTVYSVTQRLQWTRPHLLIHQPVMCLFRRRLSPVRFLGRLALHVRPAFSTRLASCIIHQR